MKSLFLLVATVLIWPANAAWAQKVYRCGNSYSQVPCPGGAPVETEDPRSPEQRKASEHSAKTERHMADKMEKERHKDEAAAARAAQQADKAERSAALKAEQKAAQENKSRSSSKVEKVPAYRAPATSGNK